VDDPERPSEAVARLLARWGIPAGAAVALTERGTNNRTLQVTAGDRRRSLRIGQNLTLAQVQAGHRLLARLARAGLSFAVPSPVPLPDGSTVAGAPDGPAALCEWIPGVRPDLRQEAALERFGRAAAELSDALAAVPPQGTPNDWPDGPLPALRDVTALARDLEVAPGWTPSGPGPAGRRGPGGGGLGGDSRAAAGPGRARRPGRVQCAGQPG
jgi:Ser/Thr protein kinase RdoA (MazF antagonist)